MPQMTSVTLTGDGVDHVYAPRGRDANNVATLVESTGVPIGDRRMTVQRTRTSQGREKVSIKLTIPVVATEIVGGIARPSVARTAYADIVISVDGTSTKDERKDLRLQLADLLGASQTLSADVIDDLATLY